MPWVKKVHDCQMPPVPRGVAVGSQWKCRKCKRVWRIRWIDGGRCGWREVPS